MWINTTHGDAWTVLAQVPISSQPQFQDSQLDHRLFDKKKGVRDGNKTAAKHYDSYEQGNQRDAIKFFTNSITQMLKLNLFQICQDRNIKNYPGEGVELLSADYHNRSTFLHEAALVVSAMIVCRSDVFHHIFFSNFAASCSTSSSHLASIINLLSALSRLCHKNQQHPLCPLFSYRTK